MSTDIFWTPAARREFARARAGAAAECPSSADLVAFAERTMDVMHRPEIERHLRFCRSCAEAMIALEATINDEANLAHGFVQRALSMFDSWLHQALPSPAFAPLHADSRALASEDVAVGDVELSLGRHPDGFLHASLQRGEAPVAGAVVQLVYLRAADADEERAGAEAVSEEWVVVRTVQATTSPAGLASLGRLEELTPRPGEQRVEVRIDFPML